MNRTAKTIMSVLVILMLAAAPLAMARVPIDIVWTCIVNPVTNTYTCTTDSPINPTYQKPIKEFKSKEK